ncbi:MAG TPA: prepilin-type N-terminal cleavage/methylation domain-containing protein [Fimbriimonadales bacterium]|nr:prepilin-type N-terminal cleavage/methylation domain-containing protein [Fimbriimonadales bacterium]
MIKKHEGFTLIELLVVIAIIAILAAILFPVFQEAKEAAKRTKCLSNFNQTNKAIQEYTSDYDEKPVLKNWLPCTSSWCCANTPIGPNRSWPQLVMPYVTNWEVIRCPADPDATDQGLSIYPGCGNAGKTTYGNKEETQFAWATRTNHGYNSQYFSPMVIWADGKQGSAPISFSQVEAAGDCIMTLDSIWDRTSKGYPSGGGNWALDPPCRYFKDPASGATKDTFPLPGGISGFYWFGGWNPTADCAWNIFGGVFVFHQGKIMWTPCSNSTDHTWRHRNYGSVIVSFADSHNKLLRIDQIAQGCDVKNAWGGFIWDRDLYLWDLK